MNILVLGASSSIGKSIVKNFSIKNRLFLLTTKSDKLNELKNEALSLGGQSVEIIECDLGTPINILESMENNINMVINIACSSSDLMDYNIDPSRFKYHTYVDLLNPLILLEHLIKNNLQNNKKADLHYIFINTILTKIQSPEKLIYNSYKILQQEYIKAYKRKYGEIFNSINVIVGTKINRTRESKKTVQLAERIKSAINNNESEFIFGFEGKLIYKLHIISPLLSKGLIYMKRIIKK